MSSKRLSGCEKNIGSSITRSTFFSPIRHPKKKKDLKNSKYFSKNKKREYL